MESTAWADASTVAFGITVPKALGDFVVLEAVYATDGTTIAVDDPELLRVQTSFAQHEGMFVCPEGAAALAAIQQVRENGWLSADELVVALNTGAGLKYPDTAPTRPHCWLTGESRFRASPMTRFNSHSATISAVKSHATMDEADL